MNAGKIFEEQIKKSIPPYALLYRLPDAAQSFVNSSQLRFSRKNPFDFILWDSNRHILYALELKTVMGVSISFEREKGESKEIHFHQVKGLNEWDKYDGIICGFIIEFRKLEKTIFLNIKEYNKLITYITKKSFNLNDLDNNNIKYQVIKQEKLKSRYKYMIDDFLNNNKEIVEE